MVCSNRLTSAAQNDWQSQLEESQTFYSINATKLLCCFTIKRRLRIDENAQKTRLVLLLQRIKLKLDSIRKKLFELRFNWISDPTQTSLSFDGTLESPVVTRACRLLNRPHSRRCFSEYRARKMQGY